MQRVRYRVMNIRRDLRNDRGDIMVLAIFFTLVLVGAMAYFLYAVPIAKTVSTQMRSDLAGICAAIAEQPFTYKQARDEFFEQISLKEYRHATITRAILYMPLMEAQVAASVANLPIDYDPKDYRSDLTGGDGSPAVPSYGGSNPCNASEIGVTGIGSCGSGGSDIKCCAVPTFGWDSSSRQPGINPSSQYAYDYNSAYVKVPKTLGLHSYYSGNLIGCEVWAEPNRNVMEKFLKPTTGEISARAFFLRQPFGMDQQGTLFVPADGSNLPTLTLIIDPFVQPGGVGGGGGRWSPTSIGYNGYVPPGDTSGVFGGDFPPAGAPPARVPFQSGGDDYDGTPINIDRVELLAIPDPNRPERLAACLNAPVMVRNAFLYHFLSFLVRDGFWARRLQVLMTEPQHRAQFAAAGTTADAHQFYPGFPNPPVMILPMENNPFERTIQMPFVNFFGRVSSNLAGDIINPDGYGGPVMGDTEEEGWTQPFVVRGSTTNEFPHDRADTKLTQLQYHSTVAGQLRDCIGLYSVLGSSLPADYAWGGNPLQDLGQWDINSNFMDASRRTRIASHQPENHWSHNFLSGEVGNPGLTHASASLNLLEFVSVLGAGQQCPHTDPAAGGCDPGERPAAENDLRGDIFAAVGALSGKNARSVYTSDAAADGVIPSAVAIPTINMPGLFLRDFDHDLKGDLIGKYKPYDSFNGTYDPAQLSNVIVIVTQNSPKPDEAEIWKKYLLGPSAIWDNMANVRIAVVYIPVRDDSNADADEANFRWIESILPPSDFAEGSNDRVIYNFGPYGETRFGVVAGEYADHCNSVGDKTPVESCFYGGANSAENAYIEYWTDLMQENTGGLAHSDYFGGNIRERARRVYDEFLTENVPLL